MNWKLGPSAVGHRSLCGETVDGCCSVGLAPPPRLKGLDFSRAEAITARDNGELLSVAMFTTMQCNLCCGYCYLDAGRALTDELQLWEYKQIITQAKESGAHTVWVPGAGEPLMQPDLPELIEFIDSKDMWLVLFTNGTLLTRWWADFLADHRVSVVVKLNSFTPSIQDALVGSRGAWDRMRHGRELLLEVGLPTHNPTRLAVETIICRQNLQEIPEIFIWARERNVFPYIETLLATGRASTGTGLEVSPASLCKLFDELLEIDQERFGYTWVPCPPYVAAHCDKLLYNITIDSQGFVHPCCGIRASLGNIREQPLTKLLRHPLLQALRYPELSLKGACAVCDSNGCLYGCRSQAEANGDIFGPCPTCWS